MAKVEVIKSSNNTDKSNYLWIIFIGILVVIGIIMFVVNVVDGFGSIEDDYLDAPLSECTNITLREGLGTISSTYSKNGIKFSYKIEKGTNTKGEERVYLKMYNMYGLYNTDIYTNIELVNGEVILGSYIYEINGSVLQNSDNIKSLLCDK